MTKCQNYLKHNYYMVITHANLHRSCFALDHRNPNPNPSNFFVQIQCLYLQHHYTH